VEIQVSQEQGRVPVTVFHLTGEINVNTYEALQDQARASFEAGMHDIVIDLGGVTYVSSAGIRAITSIFRMVRSNTPAESAEAMQKGLQDGSFKSPHLRLAAPGENVGEVLKLSGVDMFLAIYPTVADAIAAY
jgi:anti-sigma B factor antagonist